jgi:hypothetical protein
MYGCVLRQLRRGTFPFISILCLMIWSVSAQQTVPVTVVVQFRDQVPAALGTGGGDLAAATISAAGTATRLVFDDLARSPTTTITEKTAAQEKGAFSLGRPQIFGGIFRYEHVDFENSPAIDLGGNIYSTTLHTAWDINNFSFGVLVPYDYLALHALDAHRTGAILYGQYRLAVTPELSVVFLANSNYLHTAINHSFRDVNTFGGGVSVSLQADQDRVLLGGTISYQYNADDSNDVNDHQHLFKVGGNVGFRLGTNAVVNAFGTWTQDVTDYRNVVQDSSKGYLDLGIEMGLSLSKTWKINGGYKKILGLTDFDSNTVFLGTLFQF